MVLPKGPMSARLAMLLLITPLAAATARAQDDAPPTDEPTPTDEPAPDDAPDDDDEWDDDDVIVVTGLGREESREKAVHHTWVMTAEELERSGASTVADALELAPGVQLVDTLGGEGIRLQGLDPEHVLILVDGVRVGGRVDGTLDLRRLGIEDVEQIEIVEGPSATLYGSDAVAGVVHIRTKRAKPGLQANARLLVGRLLSPVRKVDPEIPRAVGVEALDSTDLTGAVGVGTEQARTRVSVGFHAGEAADNTPDTPNTRINAYRQFQLTGTGDLEVTPGHTWAGQWRWSSYRRWGIDQPATGAVLDRVNLTAEWGGSVGPTIELSDRTRLVADLGARGWSDQYRVDQRLSAEQDQYRKTEDLIGQARVRLNTVLGSRHVLAMGTEVLGEQLTAERLEPDKVTRARYAAFLQEKWDVTGTDQLALQASVRGDYDTQFGTYGSPRLGARWMPVPEVTVRLSGGRGFRAPDFREMYLVFENASAGYRIDGNPELRPETSWNAQAGVEVRPTEGVNAGVRAFYNELIDLIQPDLISEAKPGQAAIFAYVNVASARTRGGEVELGLSQPDLGGIDVAYRLTDTLDRTTDLPLSGRSLHQVTTSGFVVLPVWDVTIGTRLNWQGPRAFIDLADAEPVVNDLPGALFWDANLRATPNERFSVEVGIENVLDVGSDPETLLQTRPRRVYAGVSGRIGSTPGGEP